MLASGYGPGPTQLSRPNAETTKNNEHNEKKIKLHENWRSSILIGVSLFSLFLLFLPAARDPPSSVDPRPKQQKQWKQWRANQKVNERYLFVQFDWCFIVLIVLIVFTRS